MAASLMRKSYPLPQPSRQQRSDLRGSEIRINVRSLRLLICSEPSYARPQSVQRVHAAVRLQIRDLPRRACARKLWHRTLQQVDGTARSSLSDSIVTLAVALCRLGAHRFGKMWQGLLGFFEERTREVLAGECPLACHCAGNTRKLRQTDGGRRKNL